MFARFPGVLFLRSKKEQPHNAAQEGDERIEHRMADDLELDLGISLNHRERNPSFVAVIEVHVVLAVLHFRDLSGEGGAAGTIFRTDPLADGGQNGHSALEFIQQAGGDKPVV